MYPHPLHEKSSVIEHDFRIKNLEDWRDDTEPIIRDIITAQSKQSANIANITRLFWLVFGVSIIKMIASIFT